MLKVLVEEQKEIVDLNGLQNRLKDINYFGTVTLVFQSGDLILIREERTLKPYQVERLF